MYEQHWLVKARSSEGTLTAASPELEWGSLSRFVPDEVKAAFRELRTATGEDFQSAFPTIAKNTALMDLVENAIQQIPTEHRCPW